MKKYLYLLLAMVMTAFVFSGCQKKQAEEESIAYVEETNPENGLPLSKQPDPTAPEMDSVLVFAPVEGNISQIMDAVDELTEESLMEKLAELGTVGEGTEFVSLDTEETGETVSNGPGGGSVPAKKGVLVIKSLTPGEGITREEAEQAVADTYAANFGLSECEITVQD